MNKLNKVDVCLSHYLSNRFGLCVFASALSLMSSPALSQVELKGIDTAPNLAGSFNRNSLARDSRFNEPLDLLSDFYPSIEVRFENSSNVQRRTDVARSDNKIVVNPGLAYRTNLGRHGFYAAYTGSFERYSEFSQEDSDSNDVRVRLGLDLSSRWDLDLFTGVGNSREERGVSGTRDFFISVDDDGDIDDGPDRIDYNSVGFDLVYGRKLEHFTAVFGYERTNSSFRSESGDLIEGGDRDRTSENIHLDLDYRLSANTSVFVRIDRAETDFDRFGDSLDSKDRSWLVGLRVNPTSRISGVIGYGETERDLDDGTLNDFDGNTYYANITYAISPFSSVQFGAARSIEDPGSADDGSFFESELISLSFQHSLTDHLSFDSYVKFLDDDFDGGRQDEFVDWGVGVNYVFRHGIKVGAYYEDIDRDSNVSGIAFEDRIFGIRLSSDLRNILSKKQSRNNTSKQLPFDLNTRSLRSSAVQ